MPPSLRQRCVRNLVTLTNGALPCLDPVWEEHIPDEQARIVQLLIKRVDIGTEGLNLRLRIDGLAALAREMRWPLI